MRTHHNLAEVASLFKDEAVWPLVRALDCGGEPLFPDAPYKEAHYDPIILGFILGRNWERAREQALAAIERDLEYDKHLIKVSPKAGSETKLVKGLDIGKLEFKL